MTQPAYQPTPEFEELLRAMCDDCLTPEQARRLEEIVIADDGACWQYLRQVHLHGALHWNIGHAGTRPSSFRLDAAEVPDPAVGAALELAGAGVALPLEALVGPAVETPHQPDSLGEEPGPPIPRIIIHDSSPVEPPLWSTLFAPGGWAFSYAAATVITGVMLLVFWAWRLSHERELATSPPAARPPAVERQKPTELVGQITGTADCHWADPQDVPPTAVPLGRKYDLASGLVEISYQSGAKVILQGPCAYEVDSPAGGFLSLGKLTARVETKGEGGRGKAEETDNQKSEIRNQNSPFPLPPSPFVVRTPTATVTDLGTEFGVEVNWAGNTTSHVFRGKVKLLILPSLAGRGAGGEGDGREVLLGENESARVQNSKNAEERVLIVRSGGTAGSTLPKEEEQELRAGASQFVRQMLRRVPIKVFNTGIHVAEGDLDPHWQLVARSDDPNFQSRPAVVSSVGAAFGSWLANDPARSRWISTANGPPDLPNGVTYTFRTTFEIAGALPETAVLRGRFIADNHVDAIRLNDKATRVPEHDDYTFDRFTDFYIEKGFVEGTNALEIDVRNGAASKMGSPSEIYGGVGPMGLRVELSGAVLARQPGDDAPPRGKEDASMN